MKKPQHGFSVVEGLLITIIIGILGGVGWYVWKSQNEVDKTYSQTANSSVSPKSKKSTNSAALDSNPNYFVIKEWGVHAKYSGHLTLTYGPIGNSYAVFNSTQLSKATNGGCKEYGGGINRVKVGDSYESDVDNRPVEQMVKDPNVSFIYKNIGNYYYLFIHDQALCSDISDPKSPAADLQSQTNDAVQSLVENLEAIPAQ
jgi:hypothetical protein